MRLAAGFRGFTRISTGQESLSLDAWLFRFVFYPRKSAANSVLRG